MAFIKASNKLLKQVIYFLTTAPLRYLLDRQRTMFHGRKRIAKITPITVEVNIKE
jgi:hypothetical protein